MRDLRLLMLTPFEIPLHSLQIAAPNGRGRSRPTTRKIIAHLFSVGLLLTALSVPASAGSQSREQIAFVHLRFVGETVQLVSLKVVPGHLKPHPESPGRRISLQVALSSGKTVWKGWITDPQTRSVEGLDAASRLVRQKSAVAEPELTVRVPFLEDGQSLRILRLATGEGSAASAKLLATIPLHTR